MVDDLVLLCLLECINLLIGVKLGLEGELLQNLSALFFLCWLGQNVPLQIVVNYLAWYLLQRLFGQLEGISFEFPEWYKLNNVPCHKLLKLSGVKRLGISVKGVHAAKVGITHSDNDDRQRMFGSTDNLVYCLLHIVDDTISEDQQDLILLVKLIVNSGLTSVVHFFQDLTKVGWAIEINPSQTMHVRFHHTFEPLALWLENVTVQSKAVTCSALVRLDTRSESVSRDLFVAVIVLKDITHRFKCLQVFISLKVLAMK